jgi:tripartite ATP-independent transporter DctM subunit
MLTPEIIGIVGAIILLVLILFGCPVWLSMILVGFAGSTTIMGWSRTLGILATAPYQETASFGLAVLPMFFLMGSFALYAGIGDELYKIARTWIGNFHGGLAMATALGCALFACVSGSSLATVATFTKAALPEMRKYHYADKLSIAVIACSGTLAVLIPPSGVMVFFCMLTDTSLGRLMIAGFIPGFASVFLYIIMIYIWSRLEPGLGEPIKMTIPWRDKLLSIRWLLPVAIVATVMLGGIYLGVFSPTEAGAIGAFCTFAIALIRKSLSIDKVKKSLLDTTKSTAMILLIIIGSMIFGRFLVISGLTTSIIDMFVNIPAPPIISVCLILLVYIIGGTIMPALAMLAITLPVVFPLLTDGFGYDPVWVGIICIKILEIAGVTPPVGLNLYVAMSADKSIDFTTIVRGVGPFVIMDVITLGILVAFPVISLWLPEHMF